VSKLQALYRGTFLRRRAQQRAVRELTRQIFDMQVSLDSLLSW
jgi:hypothetical protein